MSKNCIICGEYKPLKDFYKHAKMADGHINKCKKCAKSQSKAKYHLLANDPSWVESERERGRLKYHRLGQKYKTSAESRKNWAKKTPKKIRQGMRQEK